MIKIINICKSYYKQKIVDDLSLNIDKGTVFGFLGPNGAGKTTTIKMLVGLSKPNTGKILINDKDPSLPSTRSLIGFMPENPYFYDHLKGIELVQYCDRLSGNSENHKKYQKILYKVGLKESGYAKIGTYSKGMKQRLGLACAIVHNPQYIFLDEPLDGLDPIGRIEVKEIINELKNSQKTIFFNSHILSDVEEICDQIGIINHGKLIYSGSVKYFVGSGNLEHKFVEIIKGNKNNKDE